MTAHVKRALSAEGFLSFEGLVEARPIRTEPSLGMVRVRRIGSVEEAPSGVLMFREMVTRVGALVLKYTAVMLDSDWGKEKREESEG